MNKWMSRTLIGGVLSCRFVVVALAQQTPASFAAVPTDLRPLLAPRHSEIRLVTARYAADRALLAGNYAGTVPRGGRGGPPGGGVADSTATAIVVSRNRIARLKRFDLSWQTALARVATTTLSSDGRVELDSLQQVVRANLTRLDTDATTLADFMPLFPFAPALIDLVEARLRLEDVKSQQAAETLTRVVREIGSVKVALSGNLNGNHTGRLWANRAYALRAAASVEALRSNLASWFAFYNGYDPLFTWWMGVPYRKADASLVSYVAFLRDTVATADQAPSAFAPVDSATGARTAASRIDAAPAPRYPEVPNLAEIIALPQDEMSDIVARFLGRGAGGGRGANAPQGPPRDSMFYQGWLAALNTLDFDQLSRNAQVDYLYLKHVSQLQLSRVGTTLPTDPPRKADSSGIPGAARGRAGLIRDLQDELIPYTPEQLLVLAEREFAVNEREMLKASRLMGFGNNWKAALEKTKTMHVAPGEQPAMIRDLIYQAIDYLRLHDLVTVPEVAAESQRMSMMSAEQQLVSPFFLGGAQIMVSYPTDGMDYDARMQSMRGNNRPWSHATAFHEMIPGHNLVQYTGARFAGYRANLGASGPFYGEGWPLYWELILYDKGFHATPEERVGALFWRMHRCARIIFSLKFHMGEWSPQQAIDFLVDRVGHERDNATAEVRRSFQGNYGPLYQAAYLLGGLQLRGLRRELVDTKVIAEKPFHDEILRQGSMPIALIRLALSKRKLTRDTEVEWKFAGELPQQEP